MLLWVSLSVALVGVVAGAAAAARQSTAVRPSAATRPAAVRQTARRVAAKPPVNAGPPRWRLKAGAPSELQAVIENQLNLREEAIMELKRERVRLQATLNGIARVARHARDRREWVAKADAEARDRLKIVNAQIQAMERNEVPAFQLLGQFHLPPKRASPPGHDPVLARARSFAGHHRVGWFPFVGATVVSVVDAHTAIVRPRCDDEVDFVGTDLDKVYASVEFIHQVNDRDPVIATKLPTTEGWKPGDIVPFGTHWIVRGHPLKPDGSLDSPAVTMEPFSPDALEPVDPRTTQPTTTPTTAPSPSAP